MPDHQSRQCVLDFLDAFYTGDATRLEACCHDGFTSIVHAPVDIFPHLGLKKGKAWIAQAIRIQQKLLFRPALYTAIHHYQRRTGRDADSREPHQTQRSTYRSALRR
jgi:hypothetical protein